MNILLVILVLFIALVIIGGQLRKQRLLEGKTVNPQQALEAWHNKDFFVDVRTPEEYAEGHVPGAVLIPLGELAARMTEIPRDRKVLVMCRSGYRSGNAVVTLLDNQYSDVYNVSGGILAWKGPTES